MRSHRVYKEFSENKTAAELSEEEFIDLRRKCVEWDYIRPGQCYLKAYTSPRGPEVGRLMLLDYWEDEDLWSDSLPLTKPSTYGSDFLYIPVI
jgi:hypothetical protein